MCDWLPARRYQHGDTTVCADGAKLRQVILNLVLNALDAMPTGGTITLASSLTEDGWLRLAVCDAGGGVKEAGGDVFDPFVTTKPGGAGLGLYICRRIIDRHGGRIGHENTEQGATFWFELPPGPPRPAPGPDETTT